MEFIHDTSIIIAIFAAGILAGYLLKVVIDKKKNNMHLSMLFNMSSTSSFVRTARF